MKLYPFINVSAGKRVGADRGTVLMVLPIFVIAAFVVWFGWVREKPNSLPASLRQATLTTHTPTPISPFSVVLTTTSGFLFGTDREFNGFSYEAEVIRTVTRPAGGVVRSVTPEPLVSAVSASPTPFAGAPGVIYCTPGPAGVDPCLAAYGDAELLPNWVERWTPVLLPTATLYRTFVPFVTFTPAVRASETRVPERTIFGGAPERRGERSELSRAE